jgi:hypothetical protein
VGQAHVTTKALLALKEVNQCSPYDKQVSEAMTGLKEAVGMALRRLQLLAVRTTEIDKMPGDQLKGELLRALLHDLEQTNKVLASAGAEGTPASVEAPSFHEWVMLIEQNPAQAKQLLIAVKARNKQEGLLADPSLEISIEAYERAERLFAKAATDPARAEYITRIARIGRAILGPYPDREDWLKLIDDDPGFAQSVYAALQTKRAMFGLQTPRAIEMSIAAYPGASAKPE